MNYGLPPAGRWIGYHLFLSDHVDPYLCHHLPPLLRRERAGRAFRRFFFIRYGQGAEAHLRLRFLPGERWEPAGLRASLERSAARCVEARPATAARRPAGGRLEERPYSRTTHYFGESLASVYAELLNEATSWLALDLLRALGPERRAERWVVVACLCDLLVAASAPPARRGTMIADSERFAASAAGRFGVALAARDHARLYRPAAAVERARSQVGRALGEHPEFARAARLLRRMGQLGNPEVTVATHGLHLLWNKTGFSLDEEHRAFGTLSRLGNHNGPIGRAAPPGSWHRTAGQPFVEEETA